MLSACEAAQALQDYHEDFKALNLDISFGVQADQLAVSAAGNREPYRSSVHADALLHYVLLMSRTNYCGEELIIPLLRFMAETATSEPLNAAACCMIKFETWQWIWKPVAPPIAPSRKRCSIGSIPNRSGASIHIWT